MAGLAAPLPVSFSMEEALWNLRNEGAQCDVILQGSEPNPTSTAAHRVVLVARSSYFKAMFGSSMQEARQHTVQLHNIPSDVVYMLVKYAYTSDVEIDEKNVVDLLEGALFLDMRPVADACIGFLQRHLDPDNCLMVYCVADLHQLEDVANRAKGMVLRHFQSVVKSDQFLLLDKDKVMMLIGSDDINVDSEDVVLDAALSWIVHDPIKRAALLADLLFLIRLGYARNTRELLEAFFDQLNSQDVVVPDEVMQSIIVTVPQLVYKHRKVYECIPVFVGFTRNVYCVDPRSGELTTLGGMPDGLKVSGTAAIDRCVFIVGTVQGNPVLYSYHLDSNGWRQLAGPQLAHFQGGVVALAERVYAFGGYGVDQLGQRPSRVVECYDPATDLWQLCADLPRPLSYFAFIAYQSSLFTFGNLQKGRRVYRYDLQTDVWTKCRSMSVPRAFCSACLGDDETIYVLGGTSDYELTTRCDAYNPWTDEWHVDGDLPIPGRQLAVGAMDGCVYVMGAYDRQTNVILPFPSVDGAQAYDVVTRTWSTSAVSWPYLASYMCAPVMLKKDVLRKKQRIDEMKKADEEGTEERDEDAE